jgi:hypothetical protein
MSPSPGEPWGPPRAEELGRLARATRSGWLLCAFGACLLVGAVAVEAEVGSVRPIAGGVRLPAGATSVTAEPSKPGPETTAPPVRGEALATIGHGESTTSVPATSLSDSIPPTRSTSPSKSAPTRTTRPISLEVPGNVDPPPPTTRDVNTPTPTQVPTATTSSTWPLATNAPSSSSTSRPTITTSTTARITTTTVVPFDPAQCADFFYYLLHRVQCRALLPPLSSTTSTTRRADD